MYNHPHHTIANQNHLPFSALSTIFSAFSHLSLGLALPSFWQPCIIICYQMCYKINIFIFYMGGTMEYLPSCAHFFHVTMIFSYINADTSERMSHIYSWKTIPCVYAPNFLSPFIRSEMFRSFPLLSFCKLCLLNLGVQVTIAVMK